MCGVNTLSRTQQNQQIRGSVQFVSVALMRFVTRSEQERATNPKLAADLELSICLVQRPGMDSHCRVAPHCATHTRHAESILFSAAKLNSVWCTADVLQAHIQPRRLHLGASTKARRHNATNAPLIGAQLGASVPRNPARPASRPGHNARI